MMERIRDMEAAILTADGFDDALVGVVDLWRRTKDGGATRDTAACYDYNKCVQVLMRQGMSEEDAVDWMAFNVLDAWVAQEGENMPVFLYDWRQEPSDIDLDVEVELEEEVENLRDQVRQEQHQEKEVGEQNKRGQK
jgi:hypothetical protein